MPFLRRSALFIFVFVCLFGMTACVSLPHEHEPAAKNGTQGKTTSASKSKGPFLMRPLMILIERHRKLGTHLDGPRCPMYPSCAAYAEKAIRRHSFLGLLLFIDRLFFRETGKFKNRYMITPYRLSKHLRYYDPLKDTLPIFSDRRPSLYGEDFAN